MGTHPIFESDFDCLTDMLVSRLARANCKNFLACTQTNRIDQTRQLSHGASTGMLSRPMNRSSLYHQTQKRELVAEVVISTSFLGLYYLLMERGSDSTMKPAYYQPYECGFNMLGGVVFFGYSSLLWLFVLFSSKSSCCSCSQLTISACRFSLARSSAPGRTCFCSPLSTTSN